MEKFRGMILDRNKLYSLLFITSIAGYFWLYLSMKWNLVENKSIEVCLVKRVTNIPCPSCGSTRSILTLFKGDFIGALYLNPLGYVVAFIMLIAPLWIIVDTIRRNNTLFDFYQKMEDYLKKPKIAVPLIMIIIINWIWNITKDI